MVRAPAPAMVVAIPVSAGDEVTAGDVVAVVESMKLETALQRPGLRARARDPRRPEHPGRGRHEAVAPGAGRRDDAVGQRFRARVAGRASPTPPVAALRRRHRGRRRAHLAALPRARLRHRRARRPSAAGAPSTRPARTCRPTTRTVLEGELAIFGIFADLCALSRNRRGPEDESQQVDPAGEEARNPQEYLYAYLRSRDADAEGLPESFRAKLRQALPTTACPTWSSSDATVLGAVPDVPRPPAGRRARAGAPRPAELAAAPPPTRCPTTSASATSGCSTTWSAPRSCGTPWSAASPGACATRCFDAPRDRRRAGAGPAGRARRAGPARPTTRPSGPRRSTDIVAAAEPILGGVRAARTTP